MTSEIACVVFDIDDTLYLERDYVWSGFADVGRWAETEVGLTGFFERCWEAFHAGVRGHIFDVVVAAYSGADLGLVDALVDRYRSHVPMIRLLPDADEALRRLTGHYRLAALSDGSRVSQRAKVGALGLIGRLEPIVLTEDLGPGHGKPDPEGFRLIEQLVGLGGRSCCYVGDNPSKDFRAPAELGWRTVRIRRRQGLHDREPSGADVEAEVSDLVSLESILLELSHARVSS